MLESRNADTPRGFALDLSAPGVAATVRVRPSLALPTSLEIEAPLPLPPSPSGRSSGSSSKRRGVVRWEGHASGELFTYAALLGCHQAASSSSFSEAEDEEDEQGPSSTTAAATATFTLLFPSMAERDALATLLRMGLGRLASPPWAAVEGAKAAAARAAVDAAVAAAVAGEAAARAEVERGRDEGACVDVVSIGWIGWCDLT